MTAVAPGDGTMCECKSASCQGACTAARASGGAESGPTAGGIDSGFPSATHSFEPFELCIPSSSWEVGTALAKAAAARAAKNLAACLVPDGSAPFIASGAAPWIPLASCGRSSDARVMAGLGPRRKCRCPGSAPKHAPAAATSTVAHSCLSAKPSESHSPTRSLLCDAGMQVIGAPPQVD